LRSDLQGQNSSKAVLLEAGGGCDGSGGDEVYLKLKIEEKR
jgi:hypothetical protein